jgi:hypothetical protein
MLNFDEALAGARTLARVDDLARDLWRAYEAGTIAEADAGRVSAQIEEARQRIRPKDTVAVRAPGVPLAAFSNFPPRKRRCVSPDRLASRARRRELGLVGSMPFALAARFTEGERAALAIVAAEHEAKGACDLPLEAIAARAGVCVTLARNAIRLAAAGGLAVIVERRRPGRPNLPNVVRIISREWLAWIARRRGGGCRKVNPTDYKDLNLRKSCASAKKQSNKRGDGEGGSKRQGEEVPSGWHLALEASAAGLGTAFG